MGGKKKSQAANPKTTYHENVDQVPRGGVPHLDGEVVGGGDDGAVVAIPRHHGNLQLGHLVFQRGGVVLPVGERRKSVGIQKKKTRICGTLRLACRYKFLAPSVVNQRDICNRIAEYLSMESI